MRKEISHGKVARMTFSKAPAAACSVCVCVCVHARMCAHARALVCLNMLSPRTVIPNFYDIRDQFRGRQYFHRLEVGRWFQNDSSTLHVLHTLFLLLFHQLYLRSSGIRSWGLGTPALGYCKDTWLLWQILMST